MSESIDDLNLRRLTKAWAKIPESKNAVISGLTMNAVLARCNDLADENRRLEAALREAEAKQAIDQEQCDDMTGEAGRLAVRCEELEAALEAADELAQIVSLDMTGIKSPGPRERIASRLEHYTEARAAPKGATHD